MLPSRRTTRLKDYDYALPGAYFITISTCARRLLFGSVESALVRLSPIGYIAQDCLFDLPNHHSNVNIDCKVVMPNHVHFVVMITRAIRSSAQPPAKSLASVVGGFKSAVTKRSRELKLTSESVWMPRYYDHVIRHERALERIREYIMNNPLQWSLDRENPDRLGENEFYHWMESYAKTTSELA